MNNSDEDYTCPFCKEEIKPDALKCKHCQSSLAPAKPEHEGICPFCKEDVKPNAIKCKHCSSMIGTDHSGSRCDCGCSSAPSPASEGELIRRRIGRGNSGYGWGQDCFYRCIDTEECPPGFESLCHSICEIKCGISMPRAWHSGASVFRR